MLRKPVSDRELAALGSFQGKIERFSNFRDQASGHNLGRNLRILKVLAGLQWIRGQDPSLSSAMVVAAIRQNFSSVENNQAAHFLPGQLIIGHKPVWHWAKHQELRRQLEFLFAEVDDLPAPFNQADTQAEAFGKPWGLCTAFALAASNILNGTTLGVAYGVWHQTCQQAFAEAKRSKMSKPLLPPLVEASWHEYTGESIEARSNPKKSIWNREQAVSILDYYAADQKLRSWSWASRLSAIREVESWSR
jgi:hypothetical protein